MRITFASKNSMENKERGCVVHVPAKIAAWISQANMFQTSAGKRKFTVQQVLQAMLNRIADGNIEKFMAGIDPETLMDTRGRPGGK